MLAFAKQRDATVVAITEKRQSPMSELSDHCLWTVSPPGVDPYNMMAVGSSMVAGAACDARRGADVCPPRKSVRRIIETASNSISLTSGHQRSRQGELDKWLAAVNEQASGRGESTSDTLSRPFGKLGVSSVKGTDPNGDRDVELLLVMKKFKVFRGHLPEGKPS